MGPIFRMEPFPDLSTYPCQNLVMTSPVVLPVKGGTGSQGLQTYRNTKGCCSLIILYSKWFNQMKHIHIPNISTGHNGKVMQLQPNLTVTITLKLKCRQYPAIHTNYSCSNCTISSYKDLNRSSEFLVIN